MARCVKTPNAQEQIVTTAQKENYIGSHQHSIPIMHQYMQCTGEPRELISALQGQITIQITCSRLLCSGKSREVNCKHQWWFGGVTMSESGYGYRHQARGIAVSINLAAIHWGSKCNNLSFK